MLMYLKRSMLPSFTFHPGGSDSPAGTLKVALPPSRVRMSTIAPPGLPLAGSLLPPIAGKRNAGSFETKTNFCFPLTFFRMTLIAAIG